MTCKDLRVSVSLVGISDHLNTTTTISVNSSVGHQLGISNALAAQIKCAHQGHKGPATDDLQDGMGREQDVGFVNAHSADVKTYRLEYVLP